MEIFRNIALDRSVDCEVEWRACPNQNFSAGVVIVPPGRHTVTVAWAGEGGPQIYYMTISPTYVFIADYVNGTKDIDWGSERTRRFLFQRGRLLPLGG